VSFRSLLLRHGYVFLFCYVFSVQAGLPIPADPLLLIMGAFIGDGRYSGVLSIAAAVSGAMAGDYLWYELGRRKGMTILGLLCKLSLEPDTCIRKTENGFATRGAWTLVFAKFIPGMSLISMPMAGAIRMPIERFLLADAAGCLLWSTAYIFLGLLFHRQIDRVVRLLGLYGERAGVAAVFLIALYVALRYLQRWRFRRSLRIDRVSPREALALMDGRGGILVVDLRHPAEVERSGLKIAGALVLRPEDLRSRSHEIPKGQEVILYCT
jgi:membrane protein DedA with SNARE-associated domain